MKKWMLILGVAAATLSACSNDEPSSDTKNATKKAETQQESTLPSEGFYVDTTDLKVDHIHGLGYPASGDAFMLASHHGPVMYEDGVWKETKTEKHDYMGFHAVSDGFVSSGHPEPGSDYENPLGLLKSTNLGESFEQYAFEGEIDFHYLGASYETGRIYVFNQMPVEGMENGFFYTDDLGESWETMAMEGFDAQQMSNISAHPTEADTVAIGTERGVYASDDGGKSFELAVEGVYTTYVMQGTDAAYIAELKDDKMVLHKKDLASGEGEALVIPELTAENSIIFMAQHPTNTKELTFATLQNDVYQSTDGGATWEQLLNKGSVK